MTPQEINNLPTHEERVAARRQFVRELRAAGLGTEDIAFKLFEAADVSTCAAVRDLEDR